MSVRITVGSLTVSPICGPRCSAPSAFIALPKTRLRASPVARPVRAAAAQAEADDEGLTGEWPVNWSLASYEDVGEFFQNSLFKDSASPGNSLKDIMSKELTYVYPDTKIEDLGQIFSKVRSTRRPDLISSMEPYFCTNQLLNSRNIHPWF